MSICAGESAELFLAVGAGIGGQGFAGKFCEGGEEIDLADECV